jgi:hypothetical protein
MIKDIYDISTDLLDRIQRASNTVIAIEIAYSMLEAEVEVNLEVLNAIKKLKDDDGLYKSIAALSTDALALVLFNEENRGEIQKDFLNIELLDSKKRIKRKTGIDAAFFIYRRINSLKKISFLCCENKCLQKEFRPLIRIDNIISHFNGIGQAIRKRKKVI